MTMDDLRDALTREGLFPKPALDIVQDARVRRVRLVQDVLQGEICLTQPVTEVLCEDPSTVCQDIPTSERVRGGAWATIEHSQA